jgi:hypothetical protein
MLWLCCGNITVLSRPIPLMETVQTAQFNFPSELKITTSEERELAVVILSHLRSQLENSYSSGGLKWLTERPLYNATDSHLFMLALVSYLSNHQYDVTFLGNKMYAHSGGGELTPFSSVFYKLYYTAYCVCSENRYINPKHEKYSHANVLATVIREQYVNFYDFEYLFQ